jgi:NAD(P)-dependent dehydrogenase (short-subunit alcohol dehydrogenase family)
MSLSIDQCVVAVTGGARGIGAAVAQAAAERGARVAIGDVDVATAERTAGVCPRACALELDVTDAGSWREFLGAVEERLGGVDVLVNNAGIMPVGPFLEESDAATERQLDINVLGVLLGCKAVLPGMLGRRRGHVVNIASMAGKLGVAGIVTYCASKSAVVGLSQGLEDELRDTPVAVTCVLPGVVNTELSRGLPSSPLVKEVEPAEIAAAVLSAVARPRSQVWVPATGRVSFALAPLIPVRPRNRIMRLLGVADPMLGADPVARAAYEARVGDRKEVAR